MPPPSLLLLHPRTPLPHHHRSSFRTSSPRPSRMVCAAAEGFISAAPILLPDGPWKQVEGGVTAAKGFKAAGIYGGLRAKGEKPDLALVACDVDATVAGAFTTNVVAAAPVLYCKRVLNSSKTARAVLINAGQANAATGDAGYQDTVDSADAVAKLLNVSTNDILIQSTGVIGQRIKKEALVNSLHRLVGSLSSSIEGANSAAVAITTTDLVSKSIAVQTEIGGVPIKIGGMAKGSGMIHPNMATMLGVLTTDAQVSSDVWREMVRTSVSRSFNQITVDGDTSTNDCVIALASGLSGLSSILTHDSTEAQQFQACLDAVMQGLAKSIAWDGEGATCLIEVTVAGANNEAEAAKIARSVASSSLVKAAVFGRDPNWGRIACSVGYSGIQFDADQLDISLGAIPLMKNGQPLPFDRSAASKYLKDAGDIHGTVNIDVSVGRGGGSGKAWGCDLSYKYVEINAEYTT
ncbi:arginine biosynthesis bifunctional protein ArgJ, chloroplastic [Oryza sativa Japonica Group]|uniref:Arginine biosynthesis bifunctional protein ArgJ, chloroplastic n=2 Tax=Oryza sativa TaxID=4530 RepID=ARGJ_ORYSJ|nr:arginine biosynthesis bifunctional protein ArgJ, chloroplastic [Oryza sativa Japonica Group]B8AL33.1 RecName: Full=Arginine biosynthesis bifunctional protein ArgJ, chloroplastic; Includes: RecName: Full=Glutamate N-acetyltransferase; Short=GAT; AltName: Full=Ornithine acetyltransferase; Short=OATase; AltName: Full=Ornithine transacetylase; Includes: RecName: Full=Amino-acid acetyltransferase; AltName: Full=N-acetylglutamate synthase; Short=AGS; Contains: RecName: Full=Arginine biosynthesis bifu|eukprot:NP_001049732.1 Os03g0279400 [Oryza sativa Japonica Group]